MLFRSRGDLYTHFDHPFASGPGTYQDWLSREAPNLLLPEATAA